jgi:hypothetical protein
MASARAAFVIKKGGAITSVLGAGKVSCLGVPKKRGEGGSIRGHDHKHEKIKSHGFF